MLKERKNLCCLGSLTVSSLLFDDDNAFSSLYSLCLKACAALIHPTPSVQAASMSLSLCASFAEVCGILKHKFASATSVSAKAPVREFLQPCTTPATRSPIENDSGEIRAPSAVTLPENSQPMILEGGRTAEACLSMRWLVSASGKSKNFLA